MYSLAIRFLPPLGQLCLTALFLDMPQIPGLGKQNEKAPAKVDAKAELEKYRLGVKVPPPARRGTRNTNSHTNC